MNKKLITYHFIGLMSCSFFANSADLNDFQEIETQRLIDQLEKDLDEVIDPNLFDLADELFELTNRDDKEDEMPTCTPTLREIQNQLANEEVESENTSPEKGESGKILPIMTRAPQLQKGVVVKRPVAIKRSRHEQHEDNQSNKKHCANFQNEN